MWSLLALFTAASGTVPPFQLAAMAFLVSGAIGVVSGGRQLTIDPASMAGYGAAFVAALTWSACSVLSRRLAGVATGAVAGFCLATSPLSAVAPLLLEETVWPSGPGQWLAWPASA